jgi:hypothetical protein
VRPSQPRAQCVGIDTEPATEFPARTSCSASAAQNPRGRLHRSRKLRPARCRRCGAPRQASLDQNWPRKSRTRSWATARLDLHRFSGAAGVSNLGTPSRKPHRSHRRHIDPVHEMVREHVSPLCQIDGAILPSRTGIVVARHVEPTLAGNHMSLRSVGGRNRSCGARASHPPQPR